jgi:hypothetical protein
MSIYLDSDDNGSLLIDASISDQVGQPLPVNHYGFASNSSSSLEVHVISDGAIIYQTSIEVGSTDVEVPINLDQFDASFEGHNISIEATFAQSSRYTASTQLFRLPSPEGQGSVSRIDNLYGGLWVQRGDETWRHIFPYTYYGRQPVKSYTSGAKYSIVQWSLYWDSNVTTLDEFASLGYNVIHIVPTGSLGEDPFPWDQFDEYLQRADELGLYLQYDVLWTYDNLTNMIEQVERIRSHPSLLLWYQSDEPDGKGNPINSTGIAYQKIRELDPYHPASLALNCYDFYYSEYSKGGDIIIPDVYFLTNNNSYSTVYDTVCNATYGCCGCDDCNGTFEDIPNRIDEFYRRDGLIGWDKTHWFAPQAFGNESFWTGYPSAAEEVVMTLLGINHGAKGIVMWDFPTTSEILNVTNSLALVLTSETVGDFLLEAPLTQTLSVQGADRIDAAAWVSKETNQALLSVVNLNYADIGQNIGVTAPDGIAFASVSQTLWGDVSWNVEGGQMLSTSNGLLGLQVSILIVDLVGV